MQKKSDQIFSLKIIKIAEKHKERRKFVKSRGFDTFLIELFKKKFQY